MINEDDLTKIINEIDNMNYQTYLNLYKSSIIYIKNYLNENNSENLYKFINIWKNILVQLLAMDIWEG